jgi:hypothetical protein
MRAKGMTYDTGFLATGRISRQSFDPDVVRRELAIIRDDLHCTAVQITGGDPDRLELAATYAAELGLEVWFSPYPLERTADEIMSLFTDCAERAERLRAAGAEVVFVTGVELSIMNRGFLPGNTLDERLGRLLTPPEGRQERIAAVNALLGDFLGRAVPAVRERFHGRVTYCAIPFERVDWTLYDIMAVELIRSAEVADQYREGVRTLVAQGLPVAITGFGTAAYRGAGDRGARAMEIVEYDQGTGEPVRLNDHHVRPDGDPRDDLDLASPGIVKILEGRRGTTYPDLAWEPKAAFTTVARYYGRPGHPPRAAHSRATPIRRGGGGGHDDRRVLGPRGGCGPGRVYRDTGPIAAVVVDCADPRAMARFWGEAMDWTPHEVTDEHALLRSAKGVGPYLEFLRTPHLKELRHRMHLDVVPCPGDGQAAEVARLRTLGATPADVGQGDVPWKVLADPEGNVFCVLGPA